MTFDIPALPTPNGFWPRLGWSLWPSRCLLCTEPGLPGCDLCALCWRHWPRSGRSCLGCAMPLVAPAPHSPAAADSALCGACRGRASPLSEVRAACLYRAPLDRLLPRFKFHHDLAAGRLLATTMAAAFAPVAERLAMAADAAASQRTPASGGDPSDANERASGDLSERQRNRQTGYADSSCAAIALIPVPLHRSRLRQRGYDQALELARPLSRRLNLRLCATGLHRARDTPPQSRLDAAQRRRNLRDAFAWTANASPPAHAILIDDVMTTGATLHAAALALRRAGALRVDAWVCARTL